MTRLERWAAGTAALLSLLPAGSARAKPTKSLQVLFFTKSDTFEHGVIQGRDGKPSHAETILRELGAKNGFEVTHTKDGGIFTAENLARYDVAVFFTMGDLSKVGKDGQPAMTAAGQELLLGSIRRGQLGFVGIHSAADTFHSPGHHHGDRENTAPSSYIDMIGGEFTAHGERQRLKVYSADPRFPGFAALKDGTEFMDEWYSFRNLGKDLHVIMWLATWSAQNTGSDSVYRRAPYPVVWARMYGKGRVFYTAAGHPTDNWSTPFYQSQFVGGIKWAGRLAGQDVKPNIAQVTPGFREVPPFDPPPAHATAVVPTGK